MKREGVIKVGLFTVLRDMFRLVEKWFWGISFVLFLTILFFVQYFKIDIDNNKFPSDLINTIPELLGFLMAGLTIVMGLSDSTQRRLSLRANDGHKPIKVITASISLSFIILLLTLILSYIYNNVEFCNNGCKRMWGAFVLCGVAISALSLFHVIFHLFATSTFLSGKDK